MFHLVLALFAPLAFAGNFVPVSKEHTKTYWEKAACESAEGSECADATACPLDECEIKTVSGKTQLVRDPAKLAKKVKSTDDKIKAEKKKEKDRKERKERMETQCAQAEGLVKEICDELLDK